MLSEFKISLLSHLSQAPFEKEFRVGPRGIWDKALGADAKNNETPSKTMTIKQVWRYCTLPGFWLSWCSLAMFEIVLKLADTFSQDMPRCNIPYKSMTSMPKFLSWVSDEWSLRSQIFTKQLRRWPWFKIPYWTPMSTLKRIGNCRLTSIPKKSGVDCQTIR